MKKLLAAAALCGLAAAWAGAAGAAPARFQLSDLKRLIALSDAQISPDGRRVAVIVSTPNWKTDKADKEIDLIDVATGQRRALTWKRTGLSSPRWSPDWVLDYTVAYYQQGDVYFFGGSPWTAQYRDIWRTQSPIAYAQNVKAPTLIMGDVGDPNVPLVNSYEWRHALRDNGVDVQFYAYPADTHFPSDLVRTTDVYRRWVDWMRQHLSAAERAAGAAGA